MTIINQNVFSKGILVSISNLGFLFSTVTVFVFFISIICLGSASVEQNDFIHKPELNATGFWNPTLNESQTINSTSEIMRAHKLNLSVYYETLCPFSIDFIRDQVHPTWTKLGNKYLDLKFIPYGNAHTFFKPGLVMTGCQHGEWECLGNKLHACALEYLSRDQSKAFIFCSMSKSFPPGAGVNCSRELGISSADFEMIKTCQTSIAGDLALALKGLMSLDFITNGIPALAINGMLVESDEVYENLFGLICDELRNMNEKLDNKYPAPKVCDEQHSHTTTPVEIEIEATTISSNVSSVNVTTH